MIILDGFCHLDLLNKITYQKGLEDQCAIQYSITKTFYDFCNKYNAYLREIKDLNIELAHHFKYTPEHIPKRVEQPVLELSGYEVDIMSHINEAVGDMEICSVKVALELGPERQNGIAFPIIYVGVKNVTKFN